MPSVVGHVQADILAGAALLRLTWPCHFTLWAASSSQVLCEMPVFFKCRFKTSLKRNFGPPWLLHHGSATYALLYQAIKEKVKYMNIIMTMNEKPRCFCNHSVVNNWMKACLLTGGRRGGLMVSALDSEAGSRGSSPCQPGHCVVFLGKTLYSHVASLHPGV